MVANQDAVKYVYKLSSVVVVFLLSKHTYFLNIVSNQQKAVHKIYCNVLLKIKFILKNVLFFKSA